MNSDNQYGICCRCPARMSDGRIFTNWMSQRLFNNHIMLSRNINSTHDYRRFVQNNSTEIIQNTNKMLDETHKCNFKR